MIAISSSDPFTGLSESVSTACIVKQIHFSISFVFPSTHDCSRMRFYLPILSRIFAFLIHKPKQIPQLIMSSSTDTTSTVELRQMAFPPPQLRDGEIWRDLNTTDHPSSQSSGSEDIGVVHSDNGEIKINPKRPDSSISMLQTTIIIANVSCIMFLSSMLGGLLVIGLPAIQKDIKLENNLLLWPVSVTA
jgi:hypothetical protein